MIGLNARSNVGEAGLRSFPAEDSRPEKTSGMHRCIPDRSKPNVKKLTSSFLLSSSLPFYSPLRSFEFSPAMLAERVFSLMYKDYAHSCQEESEGLHSEKMNRIVELVRVKTIIPVARRASNFQRGTTKEAGASSRPVFKRHPSMCDAEDGNHPFIGGWGSRPQKR